MRVVVAGLGSIGQRHLRNLTALEVEDIVLLRTGRATRSDPLMQQFRSVDSLSAAMALKPDAVIVANPTSLHVPTALAAAEAGAAIFMEKPISHDLQDLQRLVDMVEARGLVSLIGFQFRFHPQLQRVKALLEDGAIGTLLSGHAHWGEYLPDWHPWEDYRQGYAARADLGGGVLRTLCHPLDYLSWFCGAIVDHHVRRSRLDPLGIEVEQSAVISLEFETGALGSVYLDYCQRPKHHGFELVGSEGTLTWREADDAVRLATPERDEVFPPAAGFERNDLFLAEMRHFLDCVRANRPSLLPIADGVPLQRLLAGA